MSLNSGVGTWIESGELIREGLRGAHCASELAPYAKSPLGPFKVKNTIEAISERAVFGKIITHLSVACLLSLSPSRLAVSFHISHPEFNNMLHRQTHNPKQC